jgi:hypothetical protein
MMEDDFFEKIDEESKAYFLGLLMADGCIYSEYQMAISLLEEDLYILESFKKTIKSEHKISQMKTNNEKNQFRIAVSGKRFVGHLINQGCVKNKTKVLTYPTIPPTFQNHFIRGFFDGDGCIYVNKKNNQAKVTIVSASKLFLDELKNILKNESIDSSIKNYETYLVLSVSGNNSVEKLYEYLYSSSSFFLTRKKDKFEEFLKERNLKPKRTRMKPVCQFDKNLNLIKVYPSVLNASKICNLHHSNIRSCCLGTQKTCGGFVWKWKE